jgi:MFS superfamily sulfate permease-like transporter
MVIGSVTGAGFLVVLSPVGSLLAIKAYGTGHQRVHAGFWTPLTESGPVNLYTLGIGAGTIVLMVVLRRLARGYTCCRKWRCCSLIAVTAWRPVPGAGQGISATLEAVRYGSCIIESAITVLKRKQRSRMRNFMI